MYSKSYEKHLYLNSMYEMISQQEIIEYDMKEAGFNIIKQFKLLPEDLIEQLSFMSKKSRTIEIGKIQRKTKGLSAKMNEGFVECRRWFFYANDIQDKDVLSIKKDAIFTLRKCDNVDKGIIHFAEKNEYTDFLSIDNKEIYIGKKTDVKGIDNDLVKLHEDYILDIIRMHMKNVASMNHSYAIKFVKEILHYYKNYQLEAGYYREFNSDSMYKLKNNLFGNSFGIFQTNELDNIDIRYNYMNILIPLIRTL